ncbi:MAG: MFS transporter [Proteobacteria bacterium]|nr:MFS transporter [Pseudomonadota bacterium]
MDHARAMTSAPALRLEQDGQPLRRAAIFAVLASMALVVLDAGVANVALPTIARTLRVAPGAAILVVSAYQTALVMALLPCGALGERFGYRRVFAGGAALFTLASALCALAPTLAWLAAARFAQGLGGAAIMALGVALLRFSVPAGRFGAAIGWNALTVALCAAAGPSLGALILTGAGWPWLFAANLPLGALVLVATRALPAGPRGVGGLDVVSAVLNAAMFGALVAGAELAPRTPAGAAALLGVAAIALAALIRREAPRRAPLIPIDLLRIDAFRISVIASVCCFAGQTAGLAALPFRLQHGLGLTPLTTGLCMTAWPLSVAASAGVVARVADRAPGAWLCAGGAGLLCVGLTGLALWPATMGAPGMTGLMALCGLGFGLFQTPNNRAMFLSAPPERSGAAGALQGTARLTGQTAGAVILTLLFATIGSEAAPRTAFGLGAVLALAASVVSALRAPRALTSP